MSLSPSSLPCLSLPSAPCSVQVFRHSETAQLPRKGSDGAAGYDLFSDNDEERSLAPGKREMINTNISISIPHHTYARIAPRSGLALRGIDVVGGVVDADYRGLVQVILVNNSTSEFVVKKGDRIAQLIFEVIERPAIVECRALEELGTTNRGSAGFGSTGR